MKLRLPPHNELARRALAWLDNSYATLLVLIYFIVFCSLIAGIFTSLIMGHWLIAIMLVISFVILKNFAYSEKN